MATMMTGGSLTRSFTCIRIERASIENPNDAFALIEEYYDAVDVVLRDDRASLWHYLGDPRSPIWVAYCGMEPTGCILFHPLKEFEAAGEIKRLYVRPGYRGRGVAHHLLQAVEQFARERGFVWLYLDSKDDLSNAIAFYRRNGFEPCARYGQNPQATIFMRKRLTTVLVRTFQPGDEVAFRTLNEAWIKKHFRLEDKDVEVLNDPHGCILASGGEIFMALNGDEAIGCCALLKRDDESWEIAKMAVAEQLRGRGIGRRLLEYVIGYAKTRSLRRLYIETNSSLVNAVHLYKSVGFGEIPPERVQPSPYVRADVYLEMSLE